ncbi:MAG: hypothetical protein CK428_30550 [Mycobacterium sp.]|nr:MAG: hypothetical protein CK428_30550 [Mycobacterium sp.]
MIGNRGIMLRCTLQLVGSLLWALVPAGLMTTAIVISPYAHADPPQPGQPCNEPSRVMLRGIPKYGGLPPVVCSGIAHPTWQPMGDGVLSTTESYQIGGSCNAPSDFLALADDAPNLKLYLAYCRQGKWTPYRP